MVLPHIVLTLFLVWPSWVLVICALEEVLFDQASHLWTCLGASLCENLQRRLLTTKRNFVSFGEAGIQMTVYAPNCGSDVGVVVFIPWVGLYLDYSSSVVWTYFAGTFRFPLLSLRHCHVFPLHATQTPLYSNFLRNGFSHTFRKWHRSRCHWSITPCHWWPVPSKLFSYRT